MHNLQLTEEQDLIVETVRKFVADVVAPTVLELDEHRTFARAGFDGLAELGLFGLTIAEDNGGAGMGMLPFAAALEITGEQSASLARLFLGQFQSGLALEIAGSEALEGVMMGSSLAVYLGAEHGFKVADGKVSGSAEFVAGGGEADMFVVAATADGVPVIVTCDPAATARTALRSLGLASSAPTRVQCEGVAAVVIASGDAAKTVIERAQLAALIGVAASAVGGARAAMQLAQKHASERIAFGKPLMAQHAVVRKLVESGQRVDAARHLTLHAARLFDLGEDAFGAARQGRILAIDAMVIAADEGIQILGGYGYTVEYHVERHYRDGKTLEVLDGGSERMRDALGYALSS